MNSDSLRNLNIESQAQASFLTDVIISQENLKEKQNEKKYSLCSLELTYFAGN